MEPVLGSHHLFGGRYLLTALLGEGGMAQVYAAEDTLLGRPVAIKVLRRVGDWPGAFLDEARALARLDSPHVVSLYDVGWHDGGGYLVMKLLVGRTLADVLAASPGLPARRAVAVLAQVLEGLEHLHQHGLVHRDLKPANVLLSWADHVTLVDLGVAGTPGDGPVLAGTPRYMAPEQVAGARGDARSDVYAAGLLLFETLTGELPFRMDGQLSPTALVEIPVPLTQVVMRALAPRPQRRYASAHEMRDALFTAVARARVDFAELASVTALPGRCLAAWQDRTRDGAS